MGHIRRLQVAGTYHVTARSINEEPIFRSDADYVDFLTLVAPLGWTCHAFCVMPTHYHALVTIDDNQLPGVMHRLNRRYATRFNRRNVRRGHVFDGPYASVYVDSHSHLLWLARYIAQNPSRPKEWRWSSFTSEYSFVDATLLERSFGSRARMLRFALDS